MASPPGSPERAVTPDFIALFGALPGKYLVLDPDLYIVAATDEYLAATLTVRDEILGRYLFDVFPDNPDDPASESGRNMLTSLTRVFGLGVADVMPLARHDVRRPGPDGGFAERYWSPANSPVFNAAGEVTYVIHRVEDVTEFVKLREKSALGPLESGEPGAIDPDRAEAEIIGRRVEVAALHTQLIEAASQLRQSEQTLREFLDFAPAVISARDLDGHLLLRNRHFLARFLRPADTGAEGESAVAEFVTWSAALEKQVIESGAPVSAEAAVPAPDETTAIYEITKFPLRTPAGAVYGVGTIASDVTDDRRGREALLASEERFRQMADNIDEVFMLWEEGTLEMLYVSPPVKTIIGLDEEQFCDPVGRLAIVHPDDLEIVLSPPAPVKEFRITRPDGEVRWIRSHSIMIETAEGLPNRGVTTFVDCTDRKAAEQRAEEARAEAEAANEAKSEFLSRMSHELRTPLNAILGFGQLLAMDELTAGQRDAVEHVVGAGEHLLGLIDEVLDIAKLETGELRLSMDAVDVRAVTDEAVGMLQPLADARRIRIVVDGSGLDVHVRADHQRLRQVVVNLLANAIKYNREGGEARVHGEASGGCTRVMISDTGPGIAEVDLPRLFRPFERLSAHASEVEGTGLGLAVTKGLVTAMQGQVGVSSCIGVGSTFWVELATTDASSGGRSEIPHRSMDRRSPESGGRKVVLYVEDNASNIRLLERLVERRPDVVLVIAMEGHLALDLAIEHRPDLILMDLRLPDMPGEEVLARLRADSRLEGTPIVVLSADATTGRADQLLDLGASDFLAKPFDISRLLAVIDSAGASPGR